MRQGRVYGHEHAAHTAHDTSQNTSHKHTLHARMHDTVSTK